MPAYAGRPGRSPVYHRQPQRREYRTRGGYQRARRVSGQAQRTATRVGRVRRKQARRVYRQKARQEQQRQHKERVLQKEKREIQQALRKGKPLSARKRRLLKRNPLWRGASGKVNIARDRKLKGNLGRAGIGGAGSLLPGKAAAIDILEETTRPLHAVMGGARAQVRALSGKGSASEALPWNAPLKGLRNKERYIGSDVLEEAGVGNKTVRAVLGTTADLVFDPLNLVGGAVTVPAKGAARVAARKAAAEVGERAEKNALRQAKRRGDSLEKATKRAKAHRRQMEEHTYRKTYRKTYEAHPDKNRGLALRVGKSQTSGEGTARLSRKVGLHATAEKTRKGPIGRTVAHVRPRQRPEGLTDLEWDAYREAARRRRGTLTKRQREAVDRTKAVKRELKGAPEGTGGRIAELMEARPIATRPARVAAMRDKPLPAGTEEKVADYGEQWLETLHRRGKAAGLERARYRQLEPEDPVGHFPHTPPKYLEKKATRADRRSPPALVSASRVSSKGLQKRHYRGPFDVTKHSPDVAKVLGTRALQEASDEANAVFRRVLAHQGGRRVRRGKVDPPLNEGEGIYRLTPTGLVEVTDSAKVGRLLSGKHMSKKADYYVLKHELVDRAKQAEAHFTPNAIDQATARIKWLLTVPNPQYHVRNFYGDYLNAFSEESARNLVKGTTGAKQVLKRRAERRKSRQVIGGKLEPTQAGEKIGGEFKTYDDLLSEMEDIGAISSGQVSRELDEQLGGFSQRRFSEYREDLPRAASYIAARKRGMSPAEAAENMSLRHFEYDDLTKVERNVMRRLFPFYTFRARNIPLQARTVALRPGKPAKVQAVREEGAKAGAWPEDYEEKLTDSQRLGVPMPTSLKAGGEPIALYPGLPTTDLNVISSDLGEIAQQLGGMGNPLAKIPLELWQNRSLYFRDELSRKDENAFSRDATYVPAPDFTKGWPNALKDRFGIKVRPDPQNRKRKIAMWPVGWDYTLKSLPETSTALQLSTTARNRQGQPRWMKGVGWVTGVRPVPIDLDGRNELNRTYEKLKKIALRKDTMREDGLAYRGSGRTSAYRKLTADEKRLNKKKEQLEKSLGIDRPRAPKKPKKPPGASGGFGGGGGPTGGGLGGSGPRGGGF